MFYPFDGLSREESFAPAPARHSRVSRSSIRSCVRGPRFTDPVSFLRTGASSSRVMEPVVFRVTDPKGAHSGVYIHLRSYYSVYLIK